MNKVKLSDVADVNGKIFCINDFNEILYLDTSSVTKNVFDDFIHFSKNDKIPSRAKRAVKDRTIIYSTVRPNLQHFGIFDKPKENIVVSTGFATIDIKNNLADPKFLYYYLTQDKFTNYLHTIATNNVSSYPSINPSDLENLDLELPKDIKTQSAIARILSSLDDKIELNNKINRELENLERTIYDYWFVQNASGKWEKRKLHEIANITMGQSPDGNSYNEKGDGIIFYQGCADFGIRFPTIRQYTTNPTRFAETGDILLSVRAPVGRMNFANKKCCIGRGLAALNSKIGSITHLYYILKNLEIIFDRRNIDGTTFGAITKDDLFSLSVTKPPKDILIKFEKIAKPIFEKQFEIAEESTNLAQLRDFLLPLLMNGQVTIIEQPIIKKTLIRQKAVFKRLLLSAYILDNVCDEVTTGSVKFEKLLYLSEYCAEINIHSNFHREAAGPYDSKALHSIEKQLEDNKWFKKCTKDKRNFYNRLEKFADHKKYIESYFQTRQKTIIDDLIRFFKKAKTEQCEIVATLYGAWNDFLIDGIQPTDEQIVNEVLSNWHEEKKRIDRQRWLIALKWMREKNIVPVGYGISTKGGRK